MICGRIAAASEAPFSDAVIVEGRMAFLAGQGPIKDGAVVGSSITDQAEATLRNLDGCLARLGVSRSSVVSCTCYLSDVSQVGAFNAAYLAYFGQHRPARTTVQAQLIGGITVEITAVVALPLSSGSHSQEPSQESAP